MDKKSQIWFIDFMVGILIFVIVVVVYYGYAYNIEQNPGDLTADLIMDAKAISNSLITQGSPANWNQSDVKIIGLTDGNQRIVPEKLDMFANMTYSQTKTKLRTPYDYYLHLEYPNGSIILINDQEGIGLKPNNSQDVISLVRVIIYNSRLVNMVLQIWQ